MCGVSLQPLSITGRGARYPPTHYFWRRMCRPRPITRGGDCVCRVVPAAPAPGPRHSPGEGGDMCVEPQPPPSAAGEMHPPLPGQDRTINPQERLPNDSLTARPQYGSASLSLSLGSHPTPSSSQNGVHAALCAAQPGLICARPLHAPIGGRETPFSAVIGKYGSRTEYWPMRAKRVRARPGVGFAPFSYMGRRLR